MSLPKVEDYYDNRSGSFQGQTQHLYDRRDARVFFKLQSFAVLENDNFNLSGSYR